MMKKEIMEWIKTIILSVIIALMITTFITPTVVAEYSMRPTLNENDFLILNRFLYQHSTPERGDIIVFKTDLKTPEGDSKALIKRIIALPGDEIVIEDGKVFVNGELQKENYILEPYTRGNIKMVVPDGKVFVMGDNREYSLDSRSKILGLVDMDNIIGKAVVRLFPFNKMGFLY